MAQCKVVLDSCAYLRLAQTVHPLLGVEFGPDRRCLYVIREFQQEFDGSTRLQNKFPWVDDEEYAANRAGEIPLSKKHKRQLETVIEQFDDYAYQEDLAPSPTDLKGLAVAYLTGLDFVTDDGDLAKVAEEYGVSVLNSLELLVEMVACGQIPASKAKEACDYMEYLPDIPRDYWEDRRRHFGY